MDLTALRATAWSCIVYAWALAAAHPALTTMVLGALFARLAKFMTPEEYEAVASRKPAWFFTRWAAFRQLLAAVFSDTAKSKRIIAKILKGPPKPPVGPSILPPSDPPPPAPPPPSASGRFAIATAASLALMMAISGCSLFTRQNAKTALDAAALACVFQSEIEDEGALADACELARDLIPVIRNLIGQRDAAKLAGVRWKTEATDAGKD